MFKNQFEKKELNVRLCMGNFSICTTGSFQKSEPMQLGIPDGPFWNKSHEPNPKERDMTGLLAEDLREEAKAWCLQNSLNESEFQLTLMT